MRDVVAGEQKEPKFLFPFWLIVVLSLGGVAAFLLVGLFGYSDDPSMVRDLLRLPWPLFAWLCAMWLSIYSHALRHRALRFIRIRLLATMAAVMVALGYGWYSGLLATVAVSLVTWGRPILIPVVILCVIAAILLSITRNFFALLRVLLLFVVTVGGLIALLVASDFITRFLHSPVAGVRDEHAAFGRSLALSAIALAALMVGCLSMSFALALYLFRQQGLGAALQPIP